MGNQPFEELNSALAKLGWIIRISTNFDVVSKKMHCTSRPPRLWMNKTWAKITPLSSNANDGKDFVSCALFNMWVRQLFGADTEGWNHYFKISKGTVYWFIWLGTTLRTMSMDQCTSAIQTETTRHYAYGFLSMTEISNSVLERQFGTCNRWTTWLVCSTGLGHVSISD